MKKKDLVGLGWRVAHTNPVYQSFHFERFIGKRRVAAVILTAKTTAKAWSALCKLVEKK